VSGESDEVESEIVLPDGMELVVPPPASDEAEPLEQRGARGASGRPVSPPSFARREDVRPAA
jgi:hypothetical protein